MRRPWASTNLRNNVASCLRAAVFLLIAASRAFAAVAPTNVIETRSTTSPEAFATNKFHLEKGFRLELVASSAVVSAPVAMAFDENGRLFVAEMRADPDHPEQAPHQGRIQLLEDSDGDGIFDTSSVYADDLPWPAAIACYGGGVFVAAGPDILYLKDSQGNGLADIRRVVFTGFGEATNAPMPRPGVHSLTWGLDNRIHAGSAGLGGLIQSASGTSTQALDLAQHDFSFDPRSLTLLFEAGPSLSGLTYDDRGRKFTCDPARPLRLAMCPPVYLDRNPFFEWAPELADVTGAAGLIFPAADLTNKSSNVAPAARVDPAQRSTAGDPLRVRWPADSRSCLIYHGDLFPSNYSGNVFIADGETHLIRRAILHEHGLEVSAERPANEAGTEFLSSADASFRPTQLAAGPEGALYVADFQAGKETGRIFRIVPDAFRQRKPPQLGRASTYDLVVTLAQVDGWRRDTAARLIFQKQDAAAIPMLNSMLINSRLQHARLQALHALAGLGGLYETNLLKALRDPSDRVREHAVALSETLRAQGLPDALWEQLRALADDLSIHVRRQVAFTLGESTRADKAPMLESILRRNPEDPWIRSAVFSSLTSGAGAVFVDLAGDGLFRNSPGGAIILRNLAHMIGTRGVLQDVNEVIGFCQRFNPDGEPAFPFLYALGDGLLATRSSLALLDPNGQLRRFYELALHMALDDTFPEQRRLTAIRLLGVSPYTYADTGDLLLLLSNPSEPASLQPAAIEAVGRYKDWQVATNLAGRLSLFSPAGRQQAVASLLGRAERVPIVLAALNGGKLSNNDLTSDQINFLRTHRDGPISQWAVQRFGPLVTTRAGVLERFKPALKLNGIPSHGRELFKARCAACHEAGANARGLGPPMLPVRSQTKEKLLESILEPGLEITPGYESHVIETAEGENLVGIIQGRGPQAVQIRLVNGNLAVVPETNITHDESRSWSLMPDGVEAGLSPQDIADLLQWLRGPQN